MAATPYQAFKNHLPALYGEIAELSQEALLAESEGGLTPRAATAPADVAYALFHVLNGLDAAVRTAHNSTSPEYAIRDLPGTSGIDRDRAISNIAKLRRLYPKEN